MSFLFENCVGAHVLNICYGNSRIELMYWRERNHEIDFVIIEHGYSILAIEVKSGRSPARPTKDVMKLAGLDCPFLVVDQQNMGHFLDVLSVEKLVNQCASLNTAVGLGR